MKIVTFGNLILFSALFFSTLLLIAGIYNLGTATDWAQLLITIGTISSAIFLYSLSLNAELKTNLSILLISTFVTLVIFNIFLEFSESEIRPINPSYIALQTAKQKGLSYDTRSVSEVVDDLRNNGEIAYQAIGSIGMVKYGTRNNIFPVGGVSNATTVSCNESGYYLIYKSDRFGFNNPDKLHNSKIDVVLVGDSYTQGVCVKNNANIAGQFRKLGLNTVSYGISGNGPLLTYASLIEYAHIHKPKYVIWNWYQGNDLQELALEVKHPDLNKYLKSEYSQGLSNLQSQINQYRISQLRAYKNPILKFEKYLANNTNVDKEYKRNLKAAIKGMITLHGVRKLIGLTKEQNVTELPDEKKKSLEYLPAIFKNANDHVKSWGGTLIITIIPTFGKKQIQNELVGKELETMLKKLNIPLIDFSETYYSTEPEKMHALGLGGHHFNAYGYEKFVKYIFKNLPE